MNEQVNEQTGPAGLPAEVTPTEYFLLAVWGAVSAETQGPFPNQEARDEAARNVMREEGDDYSFHTLDITTTPGGSAEVKVGDYGCDFFTDDPDFSDDFEEAEE